MKHWQAGYHIDSGFKVEFIEMGVPNSMIFDTEKEANDYFNDQRTDKEILKEKKDLENLKRLEKELLDVESSPIYVLEKIFFRYEKGKMLLNEGCSLEDYKLLKKYIKLGLECESRHSKK